MVQEVPMKIDVGNRNASNRDAWVIAQLQGLSAGLRLLDAGAGEQRYRQYCEHLTYVSQDFGRYDGSGDGKGLQTGQWDQSGLDLVCDISSIPEPDGSFDIILCTEVLEHLPEPVVTLREFSRLLKKGGILILTAPFCSLTHFAPYHFHTGFNRYFYQRILPETGFSLILLEENGNFFEYLAQEIRRIPYVAEQHAGTRLGFLARWSSLLLLSLLQKLSSRDRGSSELLHFGFHLRAEKMS